MHNNLIRFSVGALVFSLTSLSLAADVTGKYNGKMTVDLSKTKAYMIKKDKTNGPAIGKAIDAQQKTLNTSVIKLEVLKDGSFKLTQTAGGKTETESGKWKLTGDKIKFTGLSSKNGGPTELLGTVSKNGKSLFFDLSPEMKKQMKKVNIPAEAASTGNLSFTKA